MWPRPRAPVRAGCRRLCAACRRRRDRPLSHLPRSGAMIALSMGGGRMTVMPAAFFGHGNPMNALEENRYTAAWRAFGAAVPRPRAILVVSAHWYVQATAITAMPRPRTIHD